MVRIENDSNVIKIKFAQYKFRLMFLMPYERIPKLP